jgi:hypothetical protein
MGACDQPNARRQKRENFSLSKPVPQNEESAWALSTATQDTAAITASITAARVHF